MNDETKRRMRPVDAAKLADFLRTDAAATPSERSVGRAEVRLAERDLGRYCR